MGNTEQLKNLTNAWLSPSGEIVVDAEDFYCLGAWHEELAACIVRDLMSLSHAREATEFVRKQNSFMYVYEWLEKRGWIRYCGWSLKWVVATHMKSAQRKVIERWCEATGSDWDKSVDVVFEP